MTLFLFKYCLSAILGYTLFVAIAGRANPLSIPAHRRERPAWLLGIWTALSVFAVLCIGLRLSYAMTTEYIHSLAVPAAGFLATLLIPGLILFFIYRAHIRKQSELSGYELALANDELGFDENMPAQLLAENMLDINLDPPAKKITEELKGDVVATFLQTADIDTVDVEALPAPLNDASTENPTDESHCTALTSTTDEAAKMQRIFDLQSKLSKETVIRLETEKHLRITRKALATLESISRDYESRKADSILSLEEQLAQNIGQQSELEHKATFERSRRIELETNLVNVKKDLIKAKQECRRSLAARARALSTANKSIAFARQTVQIRARLEAEIQEAQVTLVNRQNTISSLIATLEKEKRRTEEAIISSAKQLLLEEKQNQARESLENIARNVESNLTTRLVKKVAKARPLISGSLD